MERFWAIKNSFFFFLMPSCFLGSQEIFRGKINKIGQNGGGRIPRFEKLVSGCDNRRRVSFFKGGWKCKVGKWVSIVLGKQV